MIAAWPWMPVRGPVRCRHPARHHRARHQPPCLLGEGAGCHAEVLSRAASPRCHRRRASDLDRNRCCESSCSEHARQETKPGTVPEHQPTANPSGPLLVVALRSLNCRTNEAQSHHERRSTSEDAEEVDRSKRPGARERSVGAGESCEGPTPHENEAQECRQARGTAARIVHEPLPSLEGPSPSSTGLSQNSPVWGIGAAAIAASSRCRVSSSTSSP